MNTFSCQAVAEIAKAAKTEACVLPAQAESYKAHVNAKIRDAKYEVEKDNMIPGQSGTETLSGPPNFSTYLTI